MESIEFKIRATEEPYKIDFYKVDLHTLESICRILDIEGYERQFTINVSREVYREIEELVYSNHWLLIPNQQEIGELSIKLNGFNLIFKHNEVCQKH